MSVELIGILTAIVAVGCGRIWGVWEPRGPKRPTEAVRGDPGGGKVEISFLAGVTSRNGKNRTLSHQKRPASALNRRPCEVSAPTLATPFGVRVFPVPPG